MAFLFLVTHNDPVTLDIDNGTKISSRRVQFSDSGESLSIFSALSVSSTAERGWRYLNHLENAPTVTSELLVKQHEAKLSPNICPVV